MSTMTTEMSQWLAANRSTYEFYLLHAMFHDPLRRSTLMLTPLLPEDFREPSYALVMGGLIYAQKALNQMGFELPAPPSEELMKGYVNAAASQDESDDDDVAAAMSLVRSLQDPSYSAMHRYVDPYLEAWYASVRGKKAARRIQMAEVPDVAGVVRELQAAMSAAAQAAVSDEEDLMMQVMYGDDLEVQVRRPTGIPGLDRCLNGGWGDGECYLLFGGTGAGKSVAAGQCAWHEALNGGLPLVVSTELHPREYVARMVSCATSVPINLIQDCANFGQIRQAISTNPTISFKLPLVEQVLQSIIDRVRIAKVAAEEGLDARAVLEREILRFERTMGGRRPTWVCLDWLGTMADVGGGGKSSSDRAMAWEVSANGCVKLAESTGIPTLVLAQATNDAQLKSILTIGDIGIAKGIGKNMVMVVGVTNSIDKASIALAARGQGEMPRAMIKDDQFFCVCKSRKGEGDNIPVTRQFRYQRFQETRR
jgi:hypothetical protein